MKKEEGSKTKRNILIILGVLIIIIILLLLHACNNNKYNINKNPRVNMVTINKIIATSDVCDESWLEQTNKLINTLEKETKDIKDIKSNDSKYKEKLADFATLQNELKNQLQELVTYIESNETMNKETLVDNIDFSYKAYKDYYQKELGGK